MKTIAVIPAYNEEKIVGEVIVKTKNYVDEVIVINDGSQDSTADRARQAGARVYTHFLNRGLGAGLKTGLVAALKRDTDIIITLDADGQHNPAEIKKITSPIETGEAEVVIGVRSLGKMPLIRRIYKFLASLITFVLFGIWVADTQSGLRAFSRQAAEKINIKTNGMEVASEIIQNIKKYNLKLKQAPIEAIYTDYSLSKGQNLSLGIKTLLKLILHRLS